MFIFDINAYVCIRLISQYIYIILFICMYTFSCNKCVQSRNWSLVGTVGGLLA